MKKIECQGNAFIHKVQSAFKLEILKLPMVSYGYVNALHTHVYIYIQELSSFRVPTLLFIDLTHWHYLPYYTFLIRLAGHSPIHRRLFSLTCNTIIHFNQIMINNGVSSKLKECWDILIFPSQVHMLSLSKAPQLYCNLNSTKQFMPNFFMKK